MSVEQRQQGTSPFVESAPAQTTVNGVLQHQSGPSGSGWKWTRSVTPPQPSQSHPTVLSFGTAQESAAQGRAQARARSTSSTPLDLRRMLRPEAPAQEISHSQSSRASSQQPPVTAAWRSFAAATAPQHSPQQLYGQADQHQQAAPQPLLSETSWETAPSPRKVGPASRHPSGQADWRSQSPRQADKPPVAWAALSTPLAAQHSGMLGTASAPPSKVLSSQSPGTRRSETPNSHEPPAPARSWLGQAAPPLLRSNALFSPPVRLASSPCPQVQPQPRVW